MNYKGKNHYFKTRVAKMGVWSLLPGDCDTWHPPESAANFKRRFGISKGLLCIFITSSGLQHAYIPKDFFPKIYRLIDRFNAKNYKTLERKLLAFYPLKTAGKAAVTKNAVKDYSKLTDKQLAKKFVFTRKWIRKMTVFDQFGWLAEDYWQKPMAKILVKSGLTPDSEEYNQALFTLTKPEEISSTLAEKRAVLEQAIKIRKKQTSISAASKNLAQGFGWMPVFCFGEPWDEAHYIRELNSYGKKSLKLLEKEYQKLKNYSSIRNEEIKDSVRKYNISPRDLQIFVDFGLTLDARNEAEYFVSFAGSF